MASVVLISLLWMSVVIVLLPKIVVWIAGQKGRFETRLLERLEDFHIFIDARSVRWVFAFAGGLALGSAWFVLRSPWLAPVIFLGLLTGMFLLIRCRLGRRYRAIRYQLPTVIELLATSLRAGLSIRAALTQLVKQSARPISQELAMLDRMQRIGLPLERALADWAARLPVSELQLLTFTISVSAASGGGLSESLDRLAASFRQRLVLEEKVDALTAQGRMQAWVMVALPLALALVLTAMDPESMTSLWTTSSGHLVLGLVTTLEVLGLIWIRRLVRFQD
ncbi:MAG: pilus assembly protein [Burkholderiaceae bacterium]|nr:pilus assembly protein [Burkholderiaceae bacterium]